jgi:hypothetical protein
MSQEVPSMANVHLADRPQVQPVDVPGEAMRRRALVVWPRLDPAALRRCGDDAACVAVLVGRRTTLPAEAIIGILTLPADGEDEARTWFG